MKKPVKAEEIQPKITSSNYPARLATRVEGRTKTRLGDYFALSNFGVNLAQLAPGAESALKHHHEKQDEFIYILSGEATLVVGDEELLMCAGECCGFPKGSGLGHHLINKSSKPVAYLEVGDRTPGDLVIYPDDALQAAMQENGSWKIFPS